MPRVAKPKAATGNGRAFASQRRAAALPAPAQGAARRLKAVNPNAPDTTDRRTPEELLAIIDEQGRELAEALAALRGVARR